MTTMTYTWIGDIGIGLLLVGVGLIVVAVGLAMLIDLLDL